MNRKDELEILINYKLENLRQKIKQTNYNQTDLEKVECAIECINQLKIYKEELEKLEL